jgi:RNA polymerase subunit RPABC4/transcription elongation factor Spt4
MAERCVCCGAIIPEGRQVCPNCENAPLREKLIGVLDVIGSCNAEYCADCEFAKDIEGCVCRQKEIIADHLIENGVTLDNQVSSSKCDYCQEDREGYRKALGSFFLANPFHGSVWQIKTKRTKPRQIFFCPMCGRKLAEPPKGE